MNNAIFVIKPYKWNGGGASSSMETLLARNSETCR